MDITTIIVLGIVGYGLYSIYKYMKDNNQL